MIAYVNDGRNMARRFQLLKTKERTEKPLDRRTGVQEFRSSGVQEFRSARRRPDWPHSIIVGEAPPQEDR
jgi:hypothetical protein